MIGVLAWRAHLAAASRYSRGMPHAPAAFSRRFIAGVVRTAPSDFNSRRNDARPPGAFPTSFAATRSATCLIRVVFVLRFEMVDRIVESLVEIEIR